MFGVVDVSDEWFLAAAVAYADPYGVAAHVDAYHEEGVVATSPSTFTSTFTSSEARGGGEVEGEGGISSKR